MLNPLTHEKIKRFKKIKRGYYSFIILAVLILLSVVAELWINNKALVVRYNNSYYFPIFAGGLKGKIIPGTTFGLDYHYETDYRHLKKKFQQDNNGNFALLPLVPYNALENDFRKSAHYQDSSKNYGPFEHYRPSLENRHFFGRDRYGRDVLSRLVFGFRIAIFFSLILLLFNYLVGVSIGCIMGYFGGKFDLIFQRIIEIWTNVPYLYAIIIVSSIIIANFTSLLLIMIFFGWTSMTWYMRTATYKEREREYVLAARALGASDLRIIFKHILPNTISIIVTFIPFHIAGGITALTALDFLGFGLPAPTPSWGELLEQAKVGTTNTPWIGISIITAMVAVLTMVTFIGEAVREAFDPKMHTTYE